MKTPDRPLLLFLFFHLALFLQFPLTGRLPGNTDTLLSISLTNLINERVLLALSGLSGHTIFYPVTEFWAFGENCFALGWMFTFFKLLTRSDHWAYYFFMVSIFTANSYAIHRLAKLFVESAEAALLAGFAFALSNFMLGHIDDANVVFVFFPVMGLVSLESGLRSGERADFRRAALFSSLQIWFGMYVFAFQFIALAIFALIRFKRLRECLALREVAKLGAIYVLPALPIILLYVSNASRPDLTSPYGNELSRRLSSLHWYHFRNVLPGNLLYSSETNVWFPEDDPSPWYNFRKMAFPGFVLPVFALFGFIASKLRENKSVRPLAMMVLSFGALAFGSNLFDFESIVALPFGTFFRVASRAHLFALIAISVFFAIGVEKVIFVLGKKSRWATKWVPLAIGVFFILENVPFPMIGYDYTGLLEPAASYSKFFEKFPERQVVADVPSDYQARLPQTAPVWTYSRDALYMNWQTYHRQIIIGGINSYLPKTRLEADELIQKLPDSEALAGLRKLSVGWIVFHKKFVLFERENVLDGLEKAEGLKKEFEDADLAIFRL
ncbi:MAG: hypothetical protein V4760_08200 [Bdellovibrionota bacterium]